MRFDPVKKIIPVLLLLLISQFASAATLTTNPLSTSQEIGSGAFINVNWLITTTGNGGGTATSSAGTFTSAANVNSVIATRTVRLAVPSVPAGTVTAGEFFQIPTSVYTFAQTNNLSTIYYYRDFVAGAEGNTGPAFFQINLTQPATPPPSGGGTTTTTVPNTESVLTLNRIALRYSDNSIVKLIKPGTRIRAVADINYTGTGLLDALWEVADPSSTRGTPFFIPLQSVRQYLGAGGQIYLQSPVLPSQDSGNYVVRLRIREPVISLTQPILRYNVSPSGSAEAGIRLPPVSLRSPSANALLTEDTQFSWRPVKGARAYQLELYAQPKNGTRLDELGLDKQIPASGILVPGKKTGIGLGTLSRSHLQHGETYYWRIMAIGPGGQILSTSLLREIRIP